MSSTSVGNFLHFLIGHNAIIIEALIVVIVLAIVFLAFTGFLSNASGDDHSTGGADLGKIEESLKKILEQGVATKPSEGGAVSPEAEAAMQKEIEDLKVSLQEKVAEIATIKESAVGNATAAAAVDNSKLETRIRELEEKLAEYEIISEDIADLSHYKEENKKLKTEMDALKSQLASGAVAPVAKAAPAAASPAPAAPAPVESPAPAAKVVEEPQIVGKAKPLPPEEESPSYVDDDIMAEFAKAVEAQKSGGEVEEVAPVAVAEPAGTTASENATTAPADAESANPLEGSMDMDKMAAEAVDITATADSAGDATVNVLESELDPEKLAAEANSLEGGGDAKNDEHLMNEFEDFVKKGS